jgi:hypothetical protein
MINKKIAIPRKVKMANYETAVPIIGGALNETHP